MKLSKRPMAAGPFLDVAVLMDVLVAENLRRYVNGEPVLSVVDLAQGY